MEINTIMSNEDNQNFSDKELEQKKGKCSPHINSVLLPSRSKRCRFFSSWENTLYVLLVNIYPSLLLVNYKVLKFMETSLQTLIKAYSSNQVWWGNEARWASSC